MRPLFWTSNNELDRLYAEAYDAGDVAAVREYGTEIQYRVQDVGSFVWGVLGGDEFPLYGERSGFVQSDAQQGVVTGAVNLAQQAAAAAQSGANAAGGVIWGVVAPVVVLAGVVGLVVFLAGRRGR